MIYIRADGNGQIGMGHVMRCLSIADALKQQSCMPVFLTASKECIEVIEQRGFRAEYLENDYRDMLSELPVLEEKAKQHTKKPLILVDSYQVTREYYQKLGASYIVACMEDMGQSYPVDLLINYNVYAPKLSYDMTQVKKACLGASFVPLRAEFLSAMEYQVKEKVTDVMITTGGSDPLFVAKAFTDAFLEHPILKKQDICYHIISGPFNQFAEQLKETYQNQKQVVIHEHVTSMKDIMKQCDVVLTATGSTIYEVSALGVPMIVFFYAENQRQGAEELPKITSVFNAGDYAHESKQTVERAVEALCCFVEDKEYRKRLYQQEKALVDAGGAKRIACELLKEGEKYEEGQTI